MTDQDKLSTLKMDLQMKNDKNDAYLEFLLEAAAELMREEGIKCEGKLRFDIVQIHYAAYLFRNRAVQGGDTRYYANINSGNGKMPRFLRYELNELVLIGDKK